MSNFTPIKPYPKPDSYCCNMLWDCYGVDHEFGKWWIDSIKHEEIFYCPFCGVKLP